MFEKLSHRRSVLAASHLLFSAVLLASVSAARADIIYNIVDYPVNQADMINGGTDTISGTIITDGTLGVWAPDISHIVGGTLTFTWPGGTFTGAVPSDWLLPRYGTEPDATSTELLLPQGDAFKIEASTPGNPVYGVSEGIWLSYTGSGYAFPGYSGGVIIYPDDTLAEFSATSPPMPLARSELTTHGSSPRVGHPPPNPPPSSSSASAPSACWLSDGEGGQPSRPAVLRTLGLPFSLRWP